MTTPTDGGLPRLSCASVLRVREDFCEVWDGHRTARVAFAPVFPTPRVDRVQPGHLVAIATSVTDRTAILWRWFDAVLVALGDRGRVRLWEPAHGEILARLRQPTQRPEPGSRVYASSGLPGAEWWAAGAVADGPQVTDVELEAVAAFFSDNHLWASVFDS